MFSLSACAHCVEGECLDGGCVTCKPGYILNDDGTCHACPNVDDVLTCSQCSSDTRARFFSANTCLCEYNNCLYEIVSRCMSYVKDKIVLLFYYKLLSISFSITDCPLNCAFCTNADICGTCYEGFYRDANNQCQG